MGTPVLIETVAPHVRLVTLNRPSKRNAIDAATTARLAKIVIETEADPDAWVVILTGMGDVFCAGADLNAVASGEGLGLQSEEGGFAGFVQAHRKKVWICAANGPAVAGGLEMLLACDLAIAADTAHFALPEVRRGLVATAGGLIRLPRILPHALANELIATGRPLPAADALAHGIISRLVPAKDVMKVALSLAQEICDNAPLAVRESLKLAAQSHDLDTEALFGKSAEANRRILSSADAIEGAAAFVQRRKPNWTAQ